jgi:hypothetical protein
MEVKQKKELLMKDLEVLLSNPKNKKPAGVDSPGTHHSPVKQIKQDEILLNPGTIQGRVSDGDVPYPGKKESEGEEKLRSKSLFGKVPILSFGLLKSKDKDVSPISPMSKSINALVSPRLTTESGKEKASVDTPLSNREPPRGSVSIDENSSPRGPKDSPILSPKNPDFLLSLANITSNISLKINNKVTQKQTDLKKSPRDSQVLDLKELPTGTVLYNFKAANPDELSVKEGDIISIIKIESDGWTKCGCGDKTGVIPTNYYRQVQIQLGDSYREKIVLEFFMTEITYVENLKRLVSYYVKPLEAILPQTVVMAMFGNIKVVIGVNSLFLDKLENVLKCQCTITEREQKLADLLLNLAVTFKLYTAYITEFEKSCKLIREELKRNKKMEQAIKESNAQLREAGCSIFDLNSYNILPIQRLPRYRLLIEDLLRHIPEDHVENRGKVQQARDAICKIVAYCNEKQREMEGSRGLFDIQKKFELPFRPDQKLITKYVDKIEMAHCLSSEWYLLENCMAYILGGKHHVVYQYEVDSFVKIPDLMSENKDLGLICMKLKTKQELVIGVPKDVFPQLLTQCETWVTDTL